MAHAQQAKASPPSKKDLVRALDESPRADADVTKKAALVIGNTNYEYKPLKNPHNDARDMAAALTKLGFKVTLKYDLTLIQMRETANAWADSLDTHTLALVYYSGHGVTNEGQNYFVPVNNAGITHKRDVPDLAYPFTRLLEATKEAGCPLRIFILDACRNDPLPRGLRGDDGQSGLAKVNAPTGAFIAYAAGFGETASDNGDGQNGLYTSVLLKNIATPGLPIESLFKRVRGAVQKESGGEQHPDESSQLIGDFSFVDAAPANNVVPVSPKPSLIVKPAPKKPEPVEPTPQPKRRPATGSMTISEANFALLPMAGYKYTLRADLPAGLPSQIVAVYLGSDADAFRPNINIVVDTSSAGFTPQTGIQQLDGQMRQAMPNYKKFGTGSVSIDGVSGASITYGYEQNDVPVKAKFVAFIKDGKLFSVTFSAAASTFDRDASAFDKMIASIVWL